MTAQTFAQSTVSARLLTTQSALQQIFALEKLSISPNSTSALMRLAELVSSLH